MHDLHVIQGPNVTRDAREKIAFYAFHKFVVEDSSFQQNRVRAKLFFVFMWRHYFPKLKITNPSAVLVLSEVRPSNDLTFCNVSARQGFSIC